MLGEFPSNFLLQRWALGKTLSIYMLCWGERTHSSLFQKTGILTTLINRNLRHHHLRHPQLGATHGHPRTSRILRVHDITRVSSGNRHLVPHRRTRFPCTLLAIRQRRIWHNFRPHLIRHWELRTETWRNGALEGYKSVPGWVYHCGGVDLLCFVGES